MTLKSCDKCPVFLQVLYALQALLLWRSIRFPMPLLFAETQQLVTFLHSFFMMLLRCAFILRFLLDLLRIYKFILFC